MGLQNTKAQTPALFETGDRVAFNLSKRRRLDSEASNESAALTLLSLKCKRDATLHSFERELTDHEETPILRKAVGFQRGRSNSANIIASNVTQPEDPVEKKTQDSPDRRAHCAGSGHPPPPPIIQMDFLARPNPVLSKTGLPMKKPEEKLFVQSQRLPEGRPLPPPPRLPRHILQAPRRKNLGQKR